MATGPTILQSDLVVYIILPFLLIFTIVFAVLQKSKILGEGKKQIDAIVALVVGLIVISFANYVGIIVNLLPILAVGLVVLLVFFLLWGFFYPQGDFKIPKQVQYTGGGLAAIVVLIAVLYFTPAWGWLRGAFTGNSSLITNIIVIVIVIAAIVVVLMGGGKEKKKEDKS